MTCWASTSSAPSRSGSPSRAFSAIASRAAWHSSISKRLAGTKRARLGSSSRWLARPIRCTMREAPLGEASWITRSTSPQSMPRSSVEVQTTARSSPRAIAASTLRRCSARQRAVVQGDRQVVVVQPPQLLEGELGLEAGVDEDQRGPGALDGLIDLGHGVLGGVAGPGHRPSDSSTSTTGGAPAAPAPDRPRRRRRRAPASAGSRPDRRPWPKGRPGAGSARTLQPRQAQRSRSPRLDGQMRVDLVDDHAARSSK